MLLGLVAAAAITMGSAIKGIGMVTVGILIGTVGTDINTGVWRFTFNSPYLIDGVSLVALAMGLFGITEVIASINDSASAPKGSITLRRSEEHTSELQSLMRISYAVFCLKKKTEEKMHN